MSSIYQHVLRHMLQIRTPAPSSFFLVLLIAVATGWVSGRDRRGTMDIIWGSFLTFLLCTWTSVCLKIPHPKDSQLQLLGRKARWMFRAIVGPEPVLSVAIGQHASARRSVKRFHDRGHSQWTLRHALFAAMGLEIYTLKPSILDHENSPPSSGFGR